MYIRVYKVHIDTCTYKVRVYICTTSSLGLSGGSDCKESACNGGVLGLIPGLGRFPRGGHGNPLQYSCLENPMDRGAWQATVHEAAQSWT